MCITEVGVSEREREKEREREREREEREREKKKKTRAAREMKTNLSPVSSSHLHQALAGLAAVFFFWGGAKREAGSNGERTREVSEKKMGAKRLSRPASIFFSTALQLAVESDGKKMIPKSISWLEQVTSLIRHSLLSNAI